MHALEDLRFWCVDNLPVPLVKKFVDVAGAAGGRVQKLAVVCDARAPDLVRSLPTSMQQLRLRGHHVDLLFLDASDQVLQERFANSERLHPLLPEHNNADDSRDNVRAAIAQERQILQDLRAEASSVIDSSELSVHQLRRQVLRFFGSDAQDIGAELLSFSHTAGLPAQLDMLFDAEPLPLDNFLNWSTGRRLGEAAQILVSQWRDLLGELYPHFVREGKTYLTIGVVCHDGITRSAPMAEALSVALEEVGIHAWARHRERRPREGL